MKDVKSILDKRIHSYKKKSLKLNLNSLNFSNFKDKNKSKILKEKIKKIKLENIKTYDYNKKPNIEFIKIKLKNKTKIFSYGNNIEKNNYFYKYIYNNPESNNNLQKYTNNSKSFQNFIKLNKTFYSYSQNKIEKSILLQTPRGKRNELLSLSNIKINKNFTYKKENLKPFIKLPPVKLHTLSNLTIINNKNDSEIYDQVDNKMFENEKLKKRIRLSLLEDINPEEKNYKLYLDYLKPITHRYNYFEDIYIIPHFKNNFAFNKSVNDFNELYSKLCDKNFLHKKIVLSMNRIRIIRELIIKQKEKERKKMIEEIKKKPILKWKHYGELLLSEYEKQFEKYELEDSFEKCTNNQIISFANKKMKKLIFSNKFNKK